MALSKSALKRAIDSVPEGHDVGVWVVRVCRAVEAEVRKQDDELIQQPEALRLAAPLTDEQIKALMRAHRTAMLMTCKARVPECGEFAAIAQDLDWLCESFGIKGGQHGTE